MPGQQILNLQEMMSRIFFALLTVDSSFQPSHVLCSFSLPPGFLSAGMNCCIRNLKFHSLDFLSWWQFSWIIGNNTVGWEDVCLVLIPLHQTPGFLASQSSCWPHRVTLHIELQTFLTQSKQAKPQHDHSFLCSCCPLWLKNFAILLFVSGHSWQSRVHIIRISMTWLGESEHKSMSLDDSNHSTIQKNQKGHDAKTSKNTNTTSLSHQVKDAAGVYHSTKHNNRKINSHSSHNNNNNKTMDSQRNLFQGGLSMARVQRATRLGRSIAINSALYVVSTLFIFQKVAFCAVLLNDVLEGLAGKGC